mmetsp:Transcript_32093/g.74086  ORF Transcript_32093/g.74086 Transcript_32093/m.74086 type:complete len:205 (+) Transcript_32093:722-1336(+)
MLLPQRLLAAVHHALVHDARVVQPARCQQERGVLARRREGLVVEHAEGLPPRRTNRLEERLHRLVPPPLQRQQRGEGELRSQRVRVRRAQLDLGALEHHLQQVGRFVEVAVLSHSEPQAQLCVERALVPRSEDQLVSVDRVLEQHPRLPPVTVPALLAHQCGQAHHRVQSVNVVQPEALLPGLKHIFQQIACPLQLALLSQHDR